MKDQTSSKTDFSPQPIPARRSFVQTRLQNFGLTMVIMGASFALYYLGLFGTQDGPLNPTRMGTTLHDWGFSSRHLIAFLIVLWIASLIWNHLFNLVSRLRGNRMTCTVLQKKRGGKICGAPVQRSTGIYECSQGHKHNQAQFHPLRKGAWSHCLWVGCSLFVLIALNSF